MRTQRVSYTGNATVHSCELEDCSRCQGPMRIAYTSGYKTVQTMNNVLTIAQQLKRCIDEQCVRHEVAYVIVLLVNPDKTCHPISSTLCGHARW